MAESLDLSLPFSGSGQFIQLERTGALPKAQALWARYACLRKRLEEVNARLVLCNEPAWLFRFAKACFRQNKNTERELQLLTGRLEEMKIRLELQKEGVCSEMKAVNPSLPQMAINTLAGAKTMHAWDPTPPPKTWKRRHEALSDTEKTAG